MAKTANALLVWERTQIGYYAEGKNKYSGTDEPYCAYFLEYGYKAIGVGDLADLNTTEKGSLVGAINEVNVKTKKEYPLTLVFTSVVQAGEQFKITDDGSSHPWVIKNLSDIEIGYVEGFDANIIAGNGYLVLVRTDEYSLVNAVMTWQCPLAFKAIQSQGYSYFFFYTFHGIANTTYSQTLGTKLVQL